MSPNRALKMPDWPARMGEDMAAIYLGVSETTLRAGVASGRYPRPIREGKRLLWARCQLDRFVQAQFGIASEQEEGRGWAA
jgi:predicted DNA-binding transcriptional regulator AlpA